MTPSDDSSLTALTEQLREANEEFTRHYSGESGRRQPVHTVYGGAHLFKSDTAKRLGSLAKRSLDQFAPDFLSFARAVVLPGSEELPDSMEEANDLVSFLKNEPERAAKEKKGAWLQYNGELIGQGREAARQSLLEKPDLAQKIIASINEKRAGVAAAATPQRQA